MRAPGFWAEDGWRARALTPAAALFCAAGALRRRLVRPVRVSAPVICVGNPTLGGAGKTPTVQAIVARLQARGATPAVLLRGYGGAATGPVRVDPTRHTARDVGDEALLHAARAPTVVAADRPAGARLAIEQGADYLVMDDGFQNPSLRKDLSILTVDGGVGFGNGRVAPAGPLREPLAAALARADLIVLIGEDRTGARAALASRAPILEAALAPVDPSPELLGARLVAFAGIGRPRKFFESLEGAGANLAETRAFPDHHTYESATLAELRETAERSGARLATTEKDAARLSVVQRESLRTSRGALIVLRVRLAFSDESAQLLEERLTALRP
ncbi:MAG: tetraacyldisaccharide 4'-kinase [Marivibrio sp.]|uniref:tetraacyldisaccharide 4'-kinase n=1 Tax=Marivibrio sp. TaxID=2039719 RepID=UPI0032EEDD95